MQKYLHFRLKKARKPSKQMVEHRKNYATNCRRRRDWENIYGNITFISARKMKVKTPESIEWFIEDQAFLPSYDFAPPFPRKSVSCLSFLNIPVCRRSSLLTARKPSLLEIIQYSLEKTNDISSGKACVMLGLNICTVWPQNSLQHCVLYSN